MMPFLAILIFYIMAFRDSVPTSSVATLSDDQIMILLCFLFDTCVNFPSTKQQCHEYNIRYDSKVCLPLVIIKS